ncbi:MAG: radical SAM protein [Armatimonadetes bacterium]|nr:radical SAM protein [Armatimonadota bacterium]
MTRSQRATLSAREPAGIRLYFKQAPVSSLGPGKRAVIWTQGCPFRCDGCISPDSLDPEGGEEVSVDSLVAWILEHTGIEGLTISGGEPFLQARQIAQLIDRLKSQRDLGVICYTGYTMDHLVAEGSAAQKDLLKRLDLLIDGPYIRSLHADLYLRGSANQRLLTLTERYRDLIADIQNAGDKGCGLEIIVAPGGQVCVAGVPMEPDFRDNLNSALQDTNSNTRTEQEGTINAR